MSTGDNSFESSDTGRSGSPLKYAQSVTFDDPIELDRGGILPEVTVVYETYGQLNDARDNAVWICHALSGDSHVAAHDEQDDPGWWDIAVGPGRAIDTGKYFVICPNIIGGCRGTTGPNSINPKTDKRYGQDFPTITINDMVDVQLRLLDHLGIDKLLAVTGGSLGGQQTLCWAVRYPERVRGIIPMATSGRLSSQGMAFNVVGRNAIRRDPDFDGGQYYDNPDGPKVGLALARMIGHITYLSKASMHEKFSATRTEPRHLEAEFEWQFSVGSYLGFKGAEFVERFDANSYVTLSMAMDLFDLGGTVDDLAQLFKGNPCRWLVISFTSDWLFPPTESRDIVEALVRTDRPVSYCNIATDCGHDAFLLPTDLDTYGQMTGSFLATLAGEARSGPGGGPGGQQSNIFHPDHPQRLDYDVILDLVEPGASVLDLGCGNGDLLVELAARGHNRTLGLEIHQQDVIACVDKGLDVVQADLNDGLVRLCDKQFDCIVLSRALMEVMDVEGVIDGMLRVGRKCIVSFPNFGYYKLRDMLYHEGRAPEAGVLHYKWYNTPNIRVLTIKDFEELCRERGATIHQSLALDTERGTAVTGDVNRQADLAIYVISR
ncbi:MAG: homoserine O-acetyltransferase [Phycisphaerae bacterium]|jgi:homoserine O-acetyltransferase|nr:homoserine O-acetyltransferase [Phycisphaerae bacterium]